MCLTGNNCSLPATGTEGISQQSSAYLTAVSSEVNGWRLKEARQARAATLTNDTGSSSGVRLTLRCRHGKRIERATTRIDACQRRIRVERYVVTTRVGQLRNEADIGERRRLAVAERAGGTIVGELAFQCRESQIDPVAIPNVL